MTRLFIICSALFFMSLGSLYAQDSNYWVERGLEKAKEMDYSGAVKCYDKAIELNSKNTVAYNKRALSKMYLENYQGALDDYNKTIEIDSKNAEAYYFRANIEYNNYSKDDACKDWTKAMKLGYERAFEMYKEICQ